MSDNEWGDYSSGPYCTHWLELGYCDEKCKCGHRCGHTKTANVTTVNAESLKTMNSQVLLFASCYVGCVAAIAYLIIVADRRK